MDDIYKENIIDHYRNPRNFGQLKKTTVSHEEINSLCGDRIRMDLLIENDQVIDIKFSGVGCAVSLASASMLTEIVWKIKISGAGKITKDTVLELLSIPFTPTRLKCALLPWEVLQKALQKYRSKKL